MNGKITKRLRAVAKDLPRVDELQHTHMIGAEMISYYKENGLPDPKDVKGNPIDAAKTYTGKMFRAVDHVNRIKTAWQKGGEAEVNKYCAEMRRRAAAAIKDQQVAEATKALTAGDEVPELEEETFVV